MKKESVKVTGEASETQIKQWKLKHGDVFAIEIDIDENEKAVGYFKKPDLSILAMAQRFQEDKIKAGEVLFENLWLGGADIIKEDDMVKLSVMQKFPTLVELKQATIKKL